MAWVASSLALLRPNIVYPALLPTVKTYDKLPSSMVSRELRSKIRQFQHHCLHITLTVDTVSSVVSPITIYDILVNCSWVDTWWQ